MPPTWIGLGPTLSLELIAVRRSRAQMSSSVQRSMSAKSSRCTTTPRRGTVPLVALGVGRFLEMGGTALVPSFEHRTRDDVDLAANEEHFLVVAAGLTFHLIHLDSF